MLRGVKRLSAVLLAAWSAGCGGMPIAGPLRSDVVENTSSSRPSYVDYAVIDVTPAICAALAEKAPHPFRSTFGNALPKPNYAIGVGDTLAITIWEAGSNGLFSSLPSLGGVSSPRGAALPPLTVTQDGKITVPFAGRIAVAGKTPVEAEHLIVAGLSGKADNPQVIVAVSNSQSNVAVVGGEVAKAARVPLSVDGERVLDAIADAGGVRIPVNESQVRLTRGAQTAGVSYSSLLQHPDDDIYLQPGDIVTVTRAPKTFTAFGALGRNFQIAFESDALSVEEAIAKSGGLLDQRADPAGVFVFRYEPSDLVETMTHGNHTNMLGTKVPVVYRLDMSQAGGYFLARQFLVRDKDIVYAANAQLNEVQKFLNLLGSVLAPAATGASVGTAVH